MTENNTWGYKPDGIMVDRGDLLRWKREPARAYTITSITFTGVKVDYWSGQETYEFKELADACEYSKDRGETWFACNKLLTPSAFTGPVEVMSKSLAQWKELEPCLPLVALSWLVCPLFVLGTVLMAIPGAVILLLEKPFRKAMQ